MPRTLKNNDSLLNFFVGRKAFSQVWSEGQVVQMGPGDQASQGGPGWPGGQVVRWSGGKSGQGGHPGWFVRVHSYEISVFLMNYIFFCETRSFHGEKSIVPYSKLIIKKSQVFSTRSYVYLHSYKYANR